MILPISVSESDAARVKFYAAQCGLKVNRFVLLAVEQFAKAHELQEPKILIIPEQPSKARVRERNALKERALGDKALSAETAEMEDPEE